VRRLSNLTFLHVHCDICCCRSTESSTLKSLWIRERLFVQPARQLEGFWLACSAFSCPWGLGLSTNRFGTPKSTTLAWERMQHPHYASNNANGSDAVADGRHPQHITNHPTYQLALASPSSSASPSSIDSALYAQSPNGTVPAYAVSSSHRFTSSVASGDLARITPGLRRSSSLRSVANPSRAHKARSPSSATVNTFPTGHNPLPNSQASKSLFSLPTLIRRQKSNGHEKDYSLFSGSEPKRPSTPATMTTAASFRQPLSNMNYVNGGGVNNAVTPPVPTGFVAPPVPVGLNPQATYQTILDTASKRISTLDYLRKA